MLTGSAFLLLVAILLWPGKLFVGLMLNDFFFLSEAAYRVAHGYVPGIHFTGPIGIVAFLPQAFIFTWTGDLALAALVSHVIYASIVILFAWYVGLTRLHRVTGVLTAVTLSSLMLAPWVLGFSVFGQFAQSTTAMIYNRFGFILVTIAALLTIKPKETRRKLSDRLDAPMAALITALAFYCKVPFGFAAAALLLFWFTIVDYVPRFLLLFVIYIAAFVLVMEIAVPGINGGYLTEVAFIADLRETLRLGKIVRAAVFTAPEALTVAMLPLMMLALTRSVSNREIFFFICLVVGSLALLTMSNQGYVLLTPLAVAAFAVTRLLRKAADSSGVRIALCTVLISLFASVMLYLPNSLYSIVREVKYARQVEANDGLPATYAQLRVPKDVDLEMFRRSFEGEISSQRAYLSARARRPADSHHPTSPSEYLLMLTQLVEARKLCRALAIRSAVIDSTNAASSILAQAPAGGYVYMHYWSNAGTFTLKKYHDADKMFGDVNCLFDPKLPIEPQTRDAMWEVYGKYFDSKFQYAGETAYWRVLVRRDSQ